MIHEEASRLVRVTAIRDVAIDVRSFDLEPADGRPLPVFTAGAHVDVLTPGGDVRQYSLCGPAESQRGYRIAVKRESSGRGGSTSLHDRLEIGSALGIVGPRNHFPLASHAASHLLIAGGIGVTPLFAMAQHLQAEGADWSLHYCARSEAHAAFYDELRAMAPERVTAHFSELPTLDVAALLRSQPEGTHVYCCGPEGLMKATQAAGSHLPADHLHFEWFAAPATSWPVNRPFDVVLAHSERTFTVPADKSVLRVLWDHGVDVPSACEEGICGTCEVGVLAGEPQHRDLLLTSEERAANRTMMVCVSRANSSRLVLDL
jgi:ferredoxin-NADP reductase